MITSRISDMFRKPRSISLSTAEKHSYRDPQVQLRAYQPVQGRRTSLSEVLPNDRYNYKYDHGTYNSGSRTGLRKLEYGGLVSPSMHRKSYGKQSDYGTTYADTRKSTTHSTGSSEGFSFRKRDLEYPEFRREPVYNDAAKFAPPVDGARSDTRRHWRRCSTSEDGQGGRPTNVDMVSFKPRSRTKSLPPSILKTSINNYYKNEVYDRRASVGGKHAKFKEDVVVVYYLTTDMSRRFSHGERDKLKGVPYQSTVIKDDLCMDRPVKAASPQEAEADDTANSAKTEDKEPAPEVQPPKEHVITVKSTDIVTNDDNQKVLRLIVQIGQDCLREKTSVKALSGGSTVVIVTYRSEHREDSDELLHQYVEKLSLPCIVNAFLVKAHLSMARELTIEAPVVRDIETGKTEVQKL